MSPRTHSGLLSLLVLLAVLLAAPLARPSVASADRMVLSQGDADLAITHEPEGGSVGLVVNDATQEGAPVFRSADDTLLHVPPQALSQVPAGAPPAVGPAGSAVWRLPETRDEDLLWLGLSAESVPPGAFEDDELMLSLYQVEGPGPVQIFGDDGELTFDSADESATPVAIGAGTARKRNWAFHAPGLYTVSFNVDGTREGGESASSSSAQLRFYVGDLADLPPEYVYTDGLKREYEVGETVELTANQVPTSRFGDYRWMRRCVGDVEASEVGSGVTYAFSATRADDGCRLYARLLDDEGREIGVSYENLIAVASGFYGSRRILSRGHTDVLSLSLDDTDLKVRLKDDAGEEPVYREPQDVLLHAKPSSAFVLTEDLGPEYAFTGAAGDTRWILPETQDQNLLWPGWESETIAPGTVADDELDWRLLTVDGPGALKLFNGYGEDLRIFFDSERGLPASTKMSMSSHTHANWVFTAPGLYKLRFDLAGTRADTGARIASGPVEYQLFVGDLADLPAQPDTGSGEAGGDPAPGASPTPAPSGSAPAVGLPAFTPDPPTPVPGGAPLLAPTTPRGRARITAAGGPRTVRRRIATVARLECPAGGPRCPVRVPRRLRTRIAGRVHRLEVLAPTSLAPGRSAAVRVRLSQAAARRLVGRRAGVRVRLTVGTGATRRTTVVRATLRR